MNVAELAELVARMRKAQRRYFTTRRSDVLAEAKQLEADVDAALEELAEEAAPQLKLFPDR